MRGGPWTEEEDNWLREHYPKLGSQECYKLGFLDRTYNAITARTSRLGLQPARTWTQEENNWLREHYPKLGTKGCYESGYLNRTHSAIACRVNKLGLKPLRAWTREEDKWLQENYPELGSRGCFETGFLGRTRNAIMVRAQRLGVTVNAEANSRHRREVWDSSKRDSRSVATLAAHARGCFDGNSEAMKAAWVRGCYDERHISDEAKRRQAEGIKAAWARGDFDGIFTEERRRKASRSVKLAWERGDFDDRKIVCQSPTSIEVQIAAALDIMGIEHQPQYRPEGYSRIYDEFIPSHTLLEIQGGYFHSEEHFPGVQKRDAEKAQWAEDNGYELIVIWEHEIKKYGAWALVLERVGGGFNP